MIDLRNYYHYILLKDIIKINYFDEEKMDNEIKYHKIHPISHFRDHFNDILNEMNNSCEPVIVTKKGKPVGIFLSPASFNEYILLKEEADIYKAIEKSQGEIENGNFLTHKELKSRINNLLK